MQEFAQWYQPVSTELEAKANNIKLLICDIDGVFSEGTIFLGNDGEELKGFNTKDGYGVRQFMRAGIDIAIITGRTSNIVKNRMNSLGIHHIYQGMEDKITGFNQLLEDFGLDKSQVAYIGDDFPDVPVMREVGLAVSPNDGHPYVRSISDYVTVTKAGKGCVRELCDLILLTQKGPEYVLSNFEGKSQ